MVALQHFSFRIGGNKELIGENVGALSFQQIIDNYSNHPKFNFLNSCWTINSRLLVDFEEVYGPSRTHLKARNYKKCVRITNKIFVELEGQITNTEEAWFLEELQEFVLQFLKVEYEFRSKIQLRRKNITHNLLFDQAFYFDQLSSESIVKINQLSNDLVARFKLNASKGAMKRSDLSENSGEVISKICKILDGEFRSNGTFSKITEYVGIDYNYTGASLELSVAGSTWWQDTVNDIDTPKTVYAHLDESVYLPKAIVYLSEVNENNGPTTLYPNKYDELNVPIFADIVGRVISNVGSRDDSKLKEFYSKPYHQSSGSKNFREHFSKLPQEIRMSSHFGWDILPGSDLEANLAQSEIAMTGGPGKTIVFDGSRLLHRGGLITEGDRLVLQVVFYPQLPLLEKVKQKLRVFMKF
jgi:hypothetical protein